MDRTSTVNMGIFIFEHSHFIETVQISSVLDFILNPMLEFLFSLKIVFCFVKAKHTRGGKKKLKNLIQNMIRELQKN